MKNINKYSFIFKHTLALFLLLLVVGCKDDIWDDHYSQSDIRLDNNLLDVLSQDPELSQFVEYLKATENDSLLTYSRVYTVWAPTNSVLANLSTVTLNDPELLNTFIRNHISESSYSTSEVGESFLVKMLNNKYLEFSKTGSDFSFGGVNVIEQDELASNGILHKIEGILNVNPNIWEYLNLNETDYPLMMTYLNQFNDTIFDEQNSVRTGTNSLGQIVYDSLKVVSNKHFEIVGNLDLEESRFTTIGITDDAYSSIYNNFKSYYFSPFPDSIVNNTERIIYRNFNFPEFELADLNDSITTTTGNTVKLNPSNILEDIKLSNGNLLVLDQIDFDPKNIMYKPIRYELEDPERRTIGSLTSFTVTKKYDINASGEFVNEVKLFEAPNFNQSNNYFEVAFTDVLSADYNINIKFNPINGDFKKTKLRFEFSHLGYTAQPVVYEIPSIEVDFDEDGVVQIGDTYSIPFYVSKEPTDIFFAKLKVFVDVSDVELVLYDRQFAIDYLELVPAN